MSYFLAKGVVSEAVASSVGLGQGGGGWVEQKVQVHFCLRTLMILQGQHRAEGGHLQVGRK